QPVLRRFQVPAWCARLRIAPAGRDAGSLPMFRSRATEKFASSRASLAARPFTGNASALHSRAGGRMPGIADDNLVWIDLEMTGLCPDRDSILEIACVVTDRELNVLATGPEFAIHHDEARLDAMDDWNRKSITPARKRKPSPSWRNGCRRASHRCVAIPSVRIAAFCIGRCRRWRNSSTTAISTFRH